jgi:competence protein ComEA
MGPSRHSDRSIATPASAPAPVTAPGARRTWWQTGAAYAGHALIVIGALSAIAGGMLWLAWRPAPARVEVAVPTPSPLRVHVASGVVSPGVYELPRGARLKEALEAAGGLLPAADPASLNLARNLIDGERIDVPLNTVPKPEARPFGAPVSPGLVDLNAATATDLEQLPEVGPVLAAAIAAWVAQHGPVARVDELLAVEGVGPKTVEAIRPFVMQQ